MTRFISRFAVLVLLASLLSGCFLTKLVSTPMRIMGAGISVVGAAVSIVPVVGNSADATLEKADGFIDGTADTLDDVPL